MSYQVPVSLSGIETKKPTEIIIQYFHIPSAKLESYCIYNNEETLLIITINLIFTVDRTRNFTSKCHILIRNILHRTLWSFKENLPLIRNSNKTHPTPVFCIRTLSWWFCFRFYSQRERREIFRWGCSRSVTGEETFTRVNFVCQLSVFRVSQRIRPSVIRTKRGPSQCWAVLLSSTLPILILKNGQ